MSDSRFAPGFEVPWETDIPWCIWTSDPTDGVTCLSVSADYTITQQLPVEAHCPAQRFDALWRCGWEAGHEGPHMPVSEELIAEGFGIVGRRSLRPDDCSGLVYQSLGRAVNA